MAFPFSSALLLSSGTGLSHRVHRVSSNASGTSCGPVCLRRPIFNSKAALISEPLRAIYLRLVRLRPVGRVRAEVLWFPPARSTSKIVRGLGGRLGIQHGFPYCQGNPGERWSCAGTVARTAHHLSFVASTTTG